MSDSRLERLREKWHSEASVDFEPACLHQSAGGQDPFEPARLHQSAGGQDPSPDVRLAHAAEYAAYHLGQISKTLKEIYELMSEKR